MELEKRRRIERSKRRSERIAFGLFRAMSIFVVGILFVILGFIAIKGISVISWDFITKMPEDGMTKGGIYPAIIGTLYLIGGSMLFSFPIGVLSGIYINEYATNGKVDGLSD